MVQPIEMTVGFFLLMFKSIGFICQIILHIYKKKDEKYVFKYIYFCGIFYLRLRLLGLKENKR